MALKPLSITYWKMTYFFIKNFYEDSIDDGSFKNDRTTQEQLFGKKFADITKEFLTN